MIGHRINRIELEDFTENAGLTETQIQILRMKYFDSAERSVVSICDELKISVTKYSKENRSLWDSIDRYLAQKETQNA
nr:MAG TPA: antitermination protein Q [Caudoviricetes sp.]